MNLTVTESCGCGARVEVNGEGEQVSLGSQLGSMLAEFRTAHAACRGRWSPEPTPLPGWPIPPPPCTPPMRHPWVNTSPPSAHIGDRP